VTIPSRGGGIGVVIGEQDMRAFAVLAVHALNVLEQEAASEDESRAIDGELPTGVACCADCCAPCGELRSMLDRGTLESVIRQAPEHLTGQWLPLDSKLLRSRWACQSRPACDPPRHG
jgi:hypothetical protein